MSTSCVSCEQGTSTWTGRGRSCASHWPGESSTRWTTCWRPGLHHRSCRTTTPGAGTTMTEVSLHPTSHSETNEQVNMLQSHMRMHPHTYLHLGIMLVVWELAFLVLLTRARSCSSLETHTQVIFSSPQPSAYKWIKYGANLSALLLAQITYTHTVILLILVHGLNSLFRAGSDCWQYKTMWNDYYTPTSGNTKQVLISVSPQVYLWNQQGENITSAHSHLLSYINRRKGRQTVQTFPLNMQPCRWMG